MQRGECAAKLEPAVLACGRRDGLIAFVLRAYSYPLSQVWVVVVVVTQNALAMRFLAVALLAASASAVIKVGDTLPSVTLDLGFPPEKVNLLERAKGKNVILMGLPGAFTPT